MPPREFYEALESTQLRALELARSGAEHGSRVVARRQLLGRGRGDHAWASPEGGLYLSMVLQLPVPPHPVFPLAVGAGLCELLGAQGIPALSIKWPNDVLVRPVGGLARKLAGILVDVLPGDARGVPAVVGVGLNVRRPAGGFGPELDGRVASVDEFVDPAPSVEEVETPVADRVLGAAQLLRSATAVAAVRKRCSELLFGVGHRATIDGADAGRIRGLGANGELRLERDGALASVLAGDLWVEGVA